MPIEQIAADDVAIVIPMLNEAAVMPRLLRLLAVLVPAPAEIIAVDGGSQDETVALVRASGFVRAVEHPMRGRAAAINRGVAEARSPLLCVLHADTILPDDALTVIRRTLANPQTALAGFTPLIAGAETVRWGTTFHNWIKTWYAPVIFRPHLFLRGCRLLFGDHAMFFRRADFLAVGGCDETLTVMEDTDLCLRLCRRGRIRLVNRVVTTSDRRVAAWGGLKANLIFLSGSALVLDCAASSTGTILMSGKRRPDAVSRRKCTTGLGWLSWPPQASLPASSDTPEVESFLPTSAALPRRGGRSCAAVAGA